MRTARVVSLAALGLAGVLAVSGRSWAAAPLCLVALAAAGELVLRALPGTPAEAGVPAARLGLVAVAGLVTLPLVALVLHAAGLPARGGPLVAGTGVAVTLAAAGAMWRERRAPARSPGLPAQRSRTNADPGAAPAVPAGAPAGEFGTAGENPRAGVAVTGGAPAGEHQRAAVAVAVAVLIAVAVGGVAVRSYLDMPRPGQPGYLSVALGGWAAGIEAPVTVPVRGLPVPVRLTSAGLATITTALRLRVGGRLVEDRPVTVAADTVRSLTVRIPALPPDGCLRAVAISVGRMSTGFYARAQAAAPGPATRHTAGRARAGAGGERGAVGRARAGAVGGRAAARGAAC